MRRQFDPSRPLHAHWHDLEQNRIGRLDVRPLQVEGRDRRRKFAVEQIELGPDFAVDGLFRCYVRAAHRKSERLAGRLVGLVPGEVVGLCRRWLPDEADAWAPECVGPREIGLSCYALVDFLAEAVMAQARKHLPVFPEGDHVLGIEPEGLVDAGPVRAGIAGDCQGQDRQNRVEQIDRGDVRPIDAQLIFGLTARFEAQQQLVLQRPGGKCAGQFQLVEPAMLGAIGALAIERYRPRGFVDDVRNRVLPIERIVIVAEGVVQPKRITELMVERGGRGPDFRLAEIHVPAVGRAVIGRGQDIDRTSLEGRNAVVGQTAVAQIVGLEKYPGAVARREEHGRRDGFALEKALIAIAVRPFDRAGQANGNIIVGKDMAKIDLAALVVPATIAQDDLPALCARLLGNPVDETAGGAASVEHGRRPFQNLDPLDVRQVAEIEGVVAHAVDEEVTIGDIAADHELIALAVSGGHADAGHVLDRVLQRQGPLVTHHLTGDDVDCLRDVAQRGVELQRRGVGGAVFRIRGRYHDVVATRTGCCGCIVHALRAKGR